MGGRVGESGGRERGESEWGSLFPGFFMGGFECSTAILPDGRRLDVLAAPQHDRKYREDLRPAAGSRTKG
ncbi:MAG TPA: hypothetical protein VFU47_13680 [Armatimonadota bacterium]|nr:hypothetical protein [Armatimonadota bacterium]